MAAIYGELIKAQLENLAADITPAVGGLVYYHTGSNFARMYNGTAWKVFADIDSTQVFTNKDIDGGTASNTNRITAPKAALATLQGLTRKAGTIVYATDTEQFLGDNGSVLAPLGGGSGSGEINAIPNPSASTTTTGWVVSGTCTVTRISTGGPLDPIIDTAFRLDGGAANDDIDVDFVLPVTLLNTKLKVSWFQTPETGAATGEWKVEVWDQAETKEYALTSDSSGESEIPNKIGNYETYFTSDSTTTLRVKYVRVTGSNHLDVTNLIVGPGIKITGAIPSNAEPHTLVTDGMGTIVSPKCLKWRDGNRLRMKGYFYVGTLDSVNAAKIFLPTGLTVDTSELGDTRSSIFGSFKQLFTANTDLSGGTNEGVWTWATGDDTSLSAATQSVSQLFAVRPADQVLANATLHSFDIDVPIAEWAQGGAVNVAENAVEFSWNSVAASSTTDDLTSFAYGPAGGMFPNATPAASNITRRVKFVSPIQPTDILITEVDLAGDGNFIQVVGQVYDSVSGFVVDNFVYTKNGGIDQYVGISQPYPVSGSDTEVDVRLGQYPSYQYGNAITASWGATNADARWRVRKISAGQALGFAEVSQNASGLVASAGQLKGTNTNDNAFAGNVGECIEHYENTGVNVQTAYTTIATVTLTPGDWDICASFGTDGGNASGNLILGVINQTPNSSAGLSRGINSTQSSFIVDTGASSIPDIRVSTSTTTTYYLNCSINGATGDYVVKGKLLARRVR